MNNIKLAGTFQAFVKLSFSILNFKIGKITKTE